LEVPAVPVKRNAGKEVGPKPLLLDRAARSRVVPVRRAPWHRRALKPTVALAVLVSVGSIVAYRMVSSVDTAGLLHAAPSWLQGYLPDRTPETQTPPTPASRTALPERPPLTLPDFVRTDSPVRTESTPPATRPVPMIYP
jgi:hypothetical protein